MNFIKTCFNSFFRTLGRILCYIAIGMILSFLFSKIDVHAQTILGDIEIGDWSSFTNGAFYNISSTDSVQNRGWDLSSDGTVGPTSSITTIMNSYGMGMNICDLSLLENNYYSFTLLIAHDDAGYYHPFYVNRSTKLGISNNSSTFFTNFNYDNLSDGIQQNYISYAQSQHIYLDSFTGIFKAPNSGTCLNLAFSSNRTMDFYIHSYAVGYRLTSLGAKPLTESQISSALSKDFDNLNNSINNLSSNINETNSKLDQAENTRKGIWETIKGIPESVANAIKGLFIPDNFDFLNDFKDTLSNKLGFIAEVPIKLIDFIISLADFTWTEFSSITFPKIEIMGVSFWNDITIDVGPILGGLKKYRYITDVLCVTLCVNTLRKMYDKFTGGSGE